MSWRRDDVAIHIEELLEQSSNPTRCKPTILEVDDRLRRVNTEDYEPKIVSIGPIHHGSDNVKSMEQHKVRFLQELLQERGDLTIDKLVEELRKVEGEARKCYSESLNLDKLGKTGFLGILLLDGCFIITLIRRYFSGKQKDPIFESEILIQISHDLLLFENQLPFFVLDSLFSMTKRGNPDDSLHHLILFLVGDIVPWLDDSNIDIISSKPDHLLSLVYQCISTKIPRKIDSSSHTQLYYNDPLGLVMKLAQLVLNTFKHSISFGSNGGRAKNSRRKGKKSPVIHINSASELKEVGGIQLKMSEDDSITFEGKVLKFPPLQVSGETESLLRNLMAYEQLQLDDDHPKHVIDYVFFLHCLTRSIKDIEILRYSGIIKNYLGGDHMILEMFDRLGTNFMRSSEFTYSDVFERLNRHCANRRNEWMANLQRTYFNSPWSVASFLAATCLLLLAAAQTFFSILAYFKRKT